MTWEIRQGRNLELLAEIPDESVQTCISSPPYWGLRDYGEDEQLGLEPTPEEYVENIVEVFRQVWRVLRDDGTLWLNLGDSYAGSVTGNTGRNDGDDDYCARTGGAKHLRHDYGAERARARVVRNHGLKPKDLVGIPWRVAFALQADGWYLRSDIIWHKPNPMPESVTDRPTKAHEYIFLLTKQPRYYYDAEAIREVSTTEAGTAGTWDGNRDFGLPNGQTRFGKPNLGGSIDGRRNRRSVWTVTTKPFSGAHFAVFPPDLIEPCVVAGSSPIACGECAAPYERIVEKGEPLIEQQQASGGDSNGEYHGLATKNFESAGAQDASATKARILAGMVERKTTGWQPTCNHSDDSGKSVVLDPFSGSGTTGLVALRHGRSYIGLELNPDYAEMSRNRIRDDAPLLNTGLEVAA